MTDKEIRNKMYLWVSAKGIFLDDKIHKEIRDIMDEYAECLRQPQEPPKKPERIVAAPATTSSDWKPYPEH